MTVRWGVAGTGAMADALIADLRLVPGAELVAVGSRTVERAEAYAARHGGVAGHTYPDLIAADLDVLHVATPHPLHRDLALAAIAAGTPVLVEKAFTATLAGAREVVAAARERRVFCMEAMWTRFQPALVRTRELVAAGEIGDLVMVQADLGAHRDFDPASRLFDPVLGGGAILDLGVYVVSLAQHFLGTPDLVVATGTRFGNGADAGAALHLAHDDGRAASLVCSLGSQTPGRAVLMGTGGSIELPAHLHHPDRVVVRRHGRPPEVLDLPARGVGYTHEIDEVHRCLAEGLLESPVMPLDDTLAVQWVMEEALAALGITTREGTVAGL